jgi:hypothetical protein
MVKVRTSFGALITACSCSCPCEDLAMRTACEIYRLLWHVRHYPEYYLPWKLSEQMYPEEASS